MAYKTQYKRGRVRQQIEIFTDLPAAEAQYHRKCSLKFRLFCSLTQPVPPGRPRKATEEEKEASFKKICEFLENDQEECQFSIEELEEVGSSNGACLYTRPWLKERLRQKYNTADHEAIFITEGFGSQSAVVNFTGFTGKLLHKNWYNDSIKGTEVEERLRVVQLAAQIILEDMKKSSNRNDLYNAPQDITGPFPNS